MFRTHKQSWLIWCEGSFLNCRLVQAGSCCACGTSPDSSQNRCLSNVKLQLADTLTASDPKQALKVNGLQVTLSMAELN